MNFDIFTFSLSLFKTFFLFRLVSGTLTVNGTNNCTLPAHVDEYVVRVGIIMDKLQTPPEWHQIDFINKNYFKDANKEIFQYHNIRLIFGEFLLREDVPNWSMNEHNLHIALEKFDSWTKNDPDIKSKNNENDLWMLITSPTTLPPRILGLTYTGSVCSNGQKHAISTLSSDIKISRLIFIQQMIYVFEKKNNLEIIHIVRESTLHANLIDDKIKNRICDHFHSVQIINETLVSEAEDQENMTVETSPESGSGSPEQEEVSEELESESGAPEKPESAESQKLESGSGASEQAESAESQKLESGSGASEQAESAESTVPESGSGAPEQAEVSESPTQNSGSGAEQQTEVSESPTTKSKSDNAVNEKMQNSFLPNTNTGFGNKSSNKHSSFFGGKPGTKLKLHQVNKTTNINTFGHTFLGVQPGTRPKRHLINNTSITNHEKNSNVHKKKRKNFLQIDVADIKRGPSRGKKKKNGLHSSFGGGSRSKGLQGFGGAPSPGEKVQSANAITAEPCALVRCAPEYMLVDTVDGCGGRCTKKSCQMVICTDKEEKVKVDGCDTCTTKKPEEEIQSANVITSAPSPGDEVQSANVTTLVPLLGEEVQSANVTTLAPSAGQEDQSSDADTVDLGKKVNWTEPAFIDPLLQCACMNGAYDCGKLPKLIRLPEKPQELDCGWNEWEEWITCQESCGFGEKNRKRSKQTNETKSDLCGSDEEKLECDLPKCPENECWNEWDHWGACSNTCGIAEAPRERTRKEGLSLDDEYCDGLGIQTRSCKVPSCQIPCIELPMGQCDESRCKIHNNDFGGLVDTPTCDDKMVCGYRVDDKDKRNDDCRGGYTCVARGCSPTYPYFCKGVCEIIDCLEIHNTELVEGRGCTDVSMYCIETPKNATGTQSPCSSCDLITDFMIGQGNTCTDVSENCINTPDYVAGTTKRSPCSLKCRADEFQCKVGTCKHTDDEKCYGPCIRHAYVNDGTEDCFDGSDELEESKIPACPKEIGRLSTNNKLPCRCGRKICRGDKTDCDSEELNDDMVCTSHVGRDCLASHYTAWWNCEKIVAQDRCVIETYPEFNKLVWHCCEQQCRDRIALAATCNLDDFFQKTHTEKYKINDDIKDNNENKMILKYGENADITCKDGFEFIYHTEYPTSYFDNLSVFCQFDGTFASFSAIGYTPQCFKKGCFHQGIDSTLNRKESIIKILKDIHSPDDCKQQCIKHAQCHYFTFHIMKQNCVLKMDKGILLGSVYAISGPKNCDENALSQVEGLVQSKGNSIISQSFPLDNWIMDSKNTNPEQENMMLKIDCNKFTYHFLLAMEKTCEDLHCNKAIPEIESPCTDECPSIFPVAFRTNLSYTTKEEASGVSEWLDIDTHGFIPDESEKKKVWYKCCEPSPHDKCQEPVAKKRFDYPPDWHMKSHVCANSKVDDKGHGFDGKEDQKWSGSAVKTGKRCVQKCHDFILQQEEKSSWCCELREGNSPEMDSCSIKKSGIALYSEEHTSSHAILLDQSGRALSGNTCKFTKGDRENRDKDCTIGFVCFINSPCKDECKGKCDRAQEFKPVAAYACIRKVCGTGMFANPQDPFNCECIDSPSKKFFKEYWWIFLLFILCTIVVCAQVYCIYDFKRHKRKLVAITESQNQLEKDIEISLKKSMEDELNDSQNKERYSIITLGKEEIRFFHENAPLQIFNSPISSIKPRKTILKKTSKAGMQPNDESSSIPIISQADPQFSKKSSEAGIQPESSSTPIISQADPRFSTGDPDPTVENNPFSNDGTLPLSISVIAKSKAALGRTRKLCKSKKKKLKYKKVKTKSALGPPIENNNNDTDNTSSESDFDKGTIKDKSIKKQDIINIPKQDDNKIKEDEKDLKKNEKTFILS